MSVIAELRVGAGDFELGQILTVKGNSSIELESLVPTGGSTVPLFWIHNSTRDSFIERVQSHPTVTTATSVDVFDDRTLFTLDWDASDDAIFRGIDDHGGQLLSAVGTAEAWEFELRFPTHEQLTEFAAHCEASGITLEVTRVYNPTKPNSGPWYGLSDPQQEAITLAVEMGYYDIPRKCSTKELAAELGISDQAVTERLRRAIDTLVNHTLVVDDSEPTRR